MLYDRQVLNNLISHTDENNTTMIGKWMANTRYNEIRERYMSVRPENEITQYYYDICLQMQTGKVFERYKRDHMVALVDLIEFLLTETDLSLALSSNIIPCCESNVFHPNL
jgi:hypothetical protein